MGKCILCSANQKIYSAINNLDIFIKNDDIYKKISAIDAFLSEFRNVTFVLQKSLKHTEYNKVFEELRDKYLTNIECTWLKDKRNQVLKEFPFELSKKIVVNIYLYGKKEKILEKKYDYSNWNDSSKILNDIKNKLKNYNMPEIYLSLKITYTENENEIDIFKYIEKGLEQIKVLLTDLSRIINIECNNCNKLKSKFQELILNILSREILFEKDYEYIPSVNKLIPQSIMIPIGISENYNINKNVKISLCNYPFFKDNSINENFDKFIKIHYQLYLIQNKNIIPTFFIFYSDNTFTSDSFWAESKSTFYRKINYIAENIESQKITAIFFVWENYGYDMDINKRIFRNNYKERIAKANKTLLCFYCIDKSLTEKSTFIDTKSIENMNSKSANVIAYKILNNNFTNEINWKLFIPLKYGFAKSYHKYLNLEKIS